MSLLMILSTFYKLLTVTISGEFLSHSVSNGNTAKSGIRFNSDGTVDKREGDTYTQVDSSTDWRIPNGSGTGYYIKFSEILTPPTPDVGTLDTWLELTSNRELSYINSANDSEKSGSFNIQISDDASGTPILDTAIYTPTAIVGLPT